MDKLADFDYILPQELIAQAPAERRDQSRLLVLDRVTGRIEHRRFFEIIDYLNAGDLLVLNDTKVIPARLLGHRRSGGRVEILLLKRLEEFEQTGSLIKGPYYAALIKPLGRLKEGEEIFFKNAPSCFLADAKQKVVAFNGADPRVVMRRAGCLPLPPYIQRPTKVDSDRIRYQTVFAKKAGAVAAPTAGLHLTRALLDRLRAKGVGVATLTLHVNYATFSPVREENLSAHRMQEEFYEVPDETVRAIGRTRKSAGRIIAVGTTVSKTLEECASRLLGSAAKTGLEGASTLFIRPPFTFRLTDVLVTNFHLPKTTLLMLVSAFAGRGAILEAYREAVEREYRFYSYGDAMMIL